MQILNQLKIKEPERKDFFLEILSDKYCRLILEAIMDVPKEGREREKEKKRKGKRGERRIDWREEANSIQTSGLITDDGKRLFLYKSKIKEVNTSFHDGQIDVDVIFNKN